MLFTYTAFGIIVALLVMMDIHFKELGLPLFMLIVLPIVLQTISLIVINNGTYVLELNQDTYNNHSVLLYLMFVFIFIVTLWGCLSNRKYYYKKKIQNIELISNLNGSNYSKSVQKFLDIIAWLIVYMYIDMLIHGIPLFNNAYGLKQAYFTTTAHLPLVTIVYGTIFIYAPGVIGYALLLFWNDKPKRKKYILMIIMMMMYNILLGFKVSGLSNIILYTLLPVSIVFLKNNSLSIRKLSSKTIKLIVGIVFSGVVMISIVLLNYSHTITSGTNVVDFFFQRTFALSNHMFWAAKTYRSGHTLNMGQALSNLYNEISAIWIQPSPDNINYGIAKLMAYLGNPDTVRWYLPRGVRMGGSFITVFYFNCGIVITCLLCVTFAYLFERIFEVYINALSRKNIIELLLSTKILYSFYSFIWNSGSLGDFFTVINIIVMLVLLVLQKFPTVRFKFER